MSKGETKQWVKSVIYSSQSDSWPASNIVGASNTYPKYGDLQTTWSAASSSTAKEWLEFTYEKSVCPTKVEIYETYNPGSCIKISARNPKNKQWIELWSGPKQTASSVSRIFAPTLKKCKFKTNEIRLDICQTGNSGYYEIDAVQLTGKLRASFEGETEFAPYQFSKPLEQGILSDVTLEVGGQDFKLHKCILSQNDLCGDLTEKTRVKINAFTAESFKPIKSLLYKGFLAEDVDDELMDDIFGKVPASDVVDLIFTLRDHKLDDVEKMVHYRLDSLIEEKSVLQVLSRMEEYIRKNTGHRFETEDPIKKMCFQCFSELYDKWPISKEFNQQFQKLDEDLQIELLTSSGDNDDDNEPLPDSSDDEEEEDDEISSLSSGSLYSDDEDFSDEDDLFGDDFSDEDDLFAPKTKSSKPKKVEKIKVEKDQKEEEEKEKSTLQTHLQDILKTGKFSDFVMKTKDGKSFKLHKFLFVGDSPYFHQLFLDSKINEIQVDESSDLIELFIEWTYVRIIKVTKPEVVKSLIAIAEKYDVKLLKDALEGNIEAPPKPIKIEYKFGWQLWNGSSGTTINKELVTRSGGNGLDRVFGDQPLQAPVHYFEVELVSMPSGLETFIGVTNNLSNSSSRKNITVQMAGSYKNMCTGKNTFWKQGDTVGVYCDFNEGKVYFLKNGKPAGISGKMNKSATYYAVCHFNYSGDKYKLKFPKTVPKSYK
eukprot:gene6952-11114_t